MCLLLEAVYSEADLLEHWREQTVEVLALIDWKIESRSHESHRFAPHLCYLSNGPLLWSLTVPELVKIASLLTHACYAIATVILSETSSH